MKSITTIFIMFSCLYWLHIDAIRMEAASDGEPQHITVNVDFPEIGQEFEFDVNLHQTVYDLKTLLLREGATVDKLWPTLFFGGQLLEDDFAISEYGIESDARLVAEVEPMMKQRFPSSRYEGLFDEYEGQMQFGQRNGYGTMKYPLDGTYEGQWKNDKQHGEGIYRGSDGFIYQGQFEDGYRSGQVICHNWDGETYEGQWRNNTRHGYGIYKFADGLTYDGKWKSGGYDHGIFKYPEGDWCEYRLTNEGESCKMCSVM